MSVMFKPFENAEYPLSVQVRYFLDRKIENKKFKFAPIYIGDDWLIFQWNRKPLFRIANIFQKYTESNLKIEDFFITENSTEKQPVWDILEDEEEKEDDYKFPEMPPDDSDESITTRELIAWYSPACFNPPSKYGIHFDAGAVLKLSNELQGAKYSQDTSLVAAILISFWHEVCHAWIEDLTSIAHFITGIDYYKYAVKKYKNYIFMEEALCNTAALGMLEVFFSDPQDSQYRQELLEKVMQYMRSQPKGYSYFRRLKRSWVTYDEVFLKNVLKLLKRIYSIDHQTALHAISCFFDSNKFSFPVLSKLPAEYRDIKRELQMTSRFFTGTNLCFEGLYMVANKYSIHVHGSRISRKKTNR